MTQSALDKCLKYARGIRNQAKRDYAYALIFSWSNRDNIPRGELGYMGAQAVHMRLSAIIKETDGQS